MRGKTRFPATGLAPVVPTLMKPLGGVSVSKIDHLDCTDICSVRKLSILACVLIVVLRVSIGWQFLYEGLWKLSTLKTARPWSAEGYLKNAQGPFREKFRGLVDHPDNLNKLDYDQVIASWDEWYQRFQQAYPDLSDDQKRKIELLLNGPAEFAEPLAALPKGVDPSKLKMPKGSFVKYDAAHKRLVTNMHLLPNERDALLDMAPLPIKAEAATAEAATKESEPGTAPTKEEVPAKDNAPAKDEGPAKAEPPAKNEAPAKDSAPKAVDPVVLKYRQAVVKLHERSSKLSLKEQLQVLLKEDPDRAGVVLEAHEGTIDYQRPGKIELYKHLLKRYELNLASARQDFNHEHLAKQFQEIQELKGMLVGPVDALTSELHAAAYKVLTLEQAASGPVPDAPTKLSQINKMTMWSLVVLGACLMAGLFSRLAALGAAGLLLMFYLAMPPWPGIPEAPGPEHSLIVNKNLIECIACLALATIPSGRWVGLDAFIRRFIFRRKTD